MGSGTLRRGASGVAVAAGGFLLLGTVAALWPNPLFVRMTPSGPVEVVLLALTAALAGIYVAVRSPACGSPRAAGAGGVLNFLGVACPVCNKVLVLLFGAPLLLTYFEPVRLYVAALGAAIVAAMVAVEIARRRRLRPRPADAGAPATS